ncbi:MAG: GIY-YIG nuclease family protein [Bacteroidales bacterium]|nr:MAG: GIY-YIG nuclease family protein [Bacteroidales bacterium]
MTATYRFPVEINTKEDIVKQIRNEFPEKPGVYLFRDREGYVVYVGKSVNLKRRVLSYFHNNKSDGRKKIKPLISSIYNAEFYETHNDFLALLLEDKLIKKYFPFYNVRQKKFKKYKYLILTNGLFPTIRVIGSLKKIRNNIVFGPFQGEYYTRTLIEIILKYFNLRLCSESNPSTKCLYHDLKYCKAPCILNIIPLEYTRIVNKVQEFLSGNSEFIIPLLERKLNHYISNAEFENAQEIKDRIEFINSYNEKQKFLTSFKFGTLELYNNTSQEPLYIFNRGRLRINNSFINTQITESNNKLFSADNELFKDSRVLLDRANIVYNWIHGRKNNFRHAFLNS